MHKPMEGLADLVAPYDPILSRIWLVGPGDSCATCALRAECPDQTQCLHLEASAGLTTRIDGTFRRFPLGARAMGRVVLDRAPFVARDEELERLGLAEPAWLRMHAARGFAAVPLPGASVGRGALAIFSRRVLDDDDVRGLAAIAELMSWALGQNPRPLRDLEREAIERTLEATRGRVSGPHGAARILGLKPTTLHSRMRKLGVRRLYTSRPSS